MKLAKRVVLLFSILLVFIMVTVNSYAAIVEPELINGNDPDIEGYIIIKVDNPVNGNYTEGEVNIRVSFSEDGKNVDWESNTEISMVYVKGGTSGYLYKYPEGEYSDSSLYAPINTGGNVPQISHVTFYYKSADDEMTGSVENTPKTTVDEESGYQPQDTNTEIIDEDVTEGDDNKDEKIVEKNEDLPKTGEESPYVMYLIGIAMIIIGINTYLLLKRKPKTEKY